MFSKSPIFTSPQFTQYYTISLRYWNGLLRIDKMTISPRINQLALYDKVVEF